MAITFNNTYATGYVGEDDGKPSTGFGVDAISANPITVVGTVTKVGDPVTVTGLLPGSIDSGNNATTNTLYVTQYDNSNPGQILFSNYNSATGPVPAAPFRYVLSNTPLTAGNRVAFTSDAALVNGTAGDAYVVCFARGTSIRTAQGDVAVEDLAIGDLAVTASGAHRPIRWIGRRSYSGVFANRNPGMLPICFAAGSLGDNVPSRELRVSPKHAMVLDGMLVPAEHLVNGSSITRTQRVESLEYFHVELDSHDVLVAEGAASESYVEDDNRNFFHNAAAYRVANPDSVVRDAVYCLPRIEEGYALEVIRQRLARRADSLCAAGSTTLHEAVRAA